MFHTFALGSRLWSAWNEAPVEHGSGATLLEALCVESDGIGEIGSLNLIEQKHLFNIVLAMGMITEWARRYSLRAITARYARGSCGTSGAVATEGPLFKVGASPLKVPWSPGRRTAWRTGQER